MEQSLFAIHKYVESCRAFCRKPLHAGCAQRLSRKGGLGTTQRNIIGRERPPGGLNVYWV